MRTVRRRLPGRVLVAGLFAGVIAGACGGPASEDRSLSSVAAELDAYLTSDSALEELKNSVCGNTLACQGLRNPFTVLRTADEAGYRSFLEDAALVAGGRNFVPAKAVDLSHAYVLAALNRAVGDLDDDQILAVTLDTAESFSDMKAVYPQMCADLLVGRASAPPADVMRELFSVERFNFNLDMSVRAAENRGKVAAGELVLPRTPQPELLTIMDSFYSSLAPETSGAVERIARGLGLRADHAVACDVQKALMNFIADRPASEAGAIMRGLSTIAS